MRTFHTISLLFNIDSNGRAHDLRMACRTKHARVRQNLALQKHFLDSDNSNVAQAYSQDYVDALRNATNLRTQSQDASGSGNTMNPVGEPTTVALGV